MRITVLGKDIDILHVDGSEPSPQEIAAIGANFNFGTALGQLRHLGASKDEVERTFAVGLGEYFAADPAPAEGRH